MTLACFLITKKALSSFGLCLHCFDHFLKKQKKTKSFYFQMGSYKNGICLLSTLEAI